jgi:SIR2-like protein
VREGLITEVLETNYDEFVEQAVLETFGEEPEASNLCATVISDLESYRRHIARPRDNRKQHALVKVVKLNGCAAAYSSVMQDPRMPPSEREMAARRIILTEEQLQSWGDKHWARELLNDRVRSRTLLFIGFGHSDPLVRHHSVQVMREFQIHAVVSPLRPYDAKEQSTASPWYENNNAPFIAAYAPALSFYQYQILRSFRDAHTLPGKNLNLVEPNGTPNIQVLTHVASVYENTFLGNDGPFLLPPKMREGAKPELPADRLLEVLTARCLCRLVTERWLGPESPLHSYLQGALRQPRALLSELCQVLFSGELNRPALFAEWLRLQRSSRLDQASSPWATACFATRGQRPGRAGYRPFLDSPIKQPMLLVLMALVSSRDSMGRLRMPSGEELLARSGAITTTDSAMPAEDRIAAYRLVEPEPEKGTRAVFATANVDRFLYGDTSAPRVVAHDNILPDHSVVVGLGRGNIGAFRRQIWFEVRPSASNTAPQSDEYSSAPANVTESTPVEGCHAAEVDSKISVRAIREVYVVGDLAAIRGGRSHAVGTSHAHESIQSLARMPESFLGFDDGWRRYCQELG